MAKKLKRNLRIRVSALIYLIAPIAILAFLIFNENGILKYLEVKDRVEALEEQIKISEEQIKKSTQKLIPLKQIPTRLKRQPEKSIT
ncbi:MAG: hypothetical protein U5K00_11830 [Melioribacteraceae bacterium]|nr:hypothetical protein [Melioribacteraceae bacterium]